MKKRVFSGVQPSGNLHIGNYIGALKQWVKMQKEKDCIFCIVDLHAITIPQDPQKLKMKTRELAALYLAVGIDPKQSTIFIQSHNSDHPVLAWILDCVASMGQLSRMTQFKSKSRGRKDSVSVGLFNYPALMAADILLYQADEVPVGEDQKQHVELTRDLAQKFNNRFGKVFKIPQVKMFKLGARIMSLQNPRQKMSKSDLDKDGVIDLLDPLDEVKRKIKIAVTDSGRDILFRKDKPAISNLLTIYSHLTNQSVSELEEKYKGKGYAEFKKDLTEVVVEFLRPIQQEFNRYFQDKKYLDNMLEKGLRKAKSLSNETLKKVYQLVGLG